MKSFQNNKPLYNLGDIVKVYNCVGVIQSINFSNVISYDVFITESYDSDKSSMGKTFTFNEKLLSINKRE